RYARRRVAPDLAADVAAEVFVIAWRRLADLPESPLPWLYGVARRVVANQIRAEGRAARLQDRISAQPVPIGGSDPAVEVTASLTLAAAFDRLTPEDR